MNKETLTPNQVATGQSITIEICVRLRVLAIPKQGGGYSVIVPALPGCVAEGDSIADVLTHSVEATQTWLDSQHEHRRLEALRIARGEPPEAG
jgi:predicted RNase H-like HicB family nuclease